jgi:UDP-2-acetamido-3-amino-2,3-dideoxy-glucuronate N-acetyltransferase
MSDSAAAYFVHPSAVVDLPCTIGAGTKIWHFSHICRGAVIGADCILGQNVFAASTAVIGDRVKIQNNVSVYDGITIEDEVFLGPSCVLTNVSNPRAQIVRHGLYEKTLIRRGATVGANATIICGCTIGRYAFAAAGAVVTKSVPDYGFVVGVPARLKGWISRHGHLLRNPNSEGILICPESGYRYQEVRPGLLRCLDLDEDAPLPPELSVGRKHYRDFKK